MYIDQGKATTRCPSHAPTAFRRGGATGTQRHGGEYADIIGQLKR